MVLVGDTTPGFLVVIILILINIQKGTLFIDFIDKNKNELIWQGIGSGALKMSNMDKKEERINEFVNKIISVYPPNLKK